MVRQCWHNKEIREVRDLVKLFRKNLNGAGKEKVYKFNSLPSLGDKHDVYILKQIYESEWTTILNVKSNYKTAVKLLKGCKTSCHFVSPSFG